VTKKYTIYVEIQLCPWIFNSKQPTAEHQNVTTPPSKKSYQLSIRLIIFRKYMLNRNRPRGLILEKMMMDYKTSIPK